MPSVVVQVGVGRALSILQDAPPPLPLYEQEYVGGTPSAPLPDAVPEPVRLTDVRFCVTELTVSVWIDGAKKSAEPLLALPVHVSVESLDEQAARAAGALSAKIDPVARIEKTSTSATRSVRRAELADNEQCSLKRRSMPNYPTFTAAARQITIRIGHGFLPLA